MSTNKRKRSVYRNYIADALRTEADYGPVMGRIVLNPNLLRLLHAAIGLSTEVGEFADTIKKAVFYGAPLDKVNIQEESGDIHWYLALIEAYLGNNDFSRTLDINIKKLRARFPNKFEEIDALERDLAAERQVLETGSYPDATPNQP